MSFAFKDSDLDGVEDSKDKCANTPILELVDKHGCPLESKRGVRGKFYLRLGTGYLRDEDEERLSSIFSIAYSYKGLYTSFTTRYYLSSKLYDPGMGDSSLFLGYSRFLSERVYILPGVRIKLPTGEEQFSDGKVDYTPSAVVDFLFDDYDVFTYISYTIRGNRNLKDTLSLSLGGGYDLTRSLYLSLSYDVSQSAVRDGNNSYVSFFALYDITKVLYTTLSYSKGINKEATDHSATLRIGIRF
jgi:hypothetical protein